MSLLTTKLYIPSVRPGLVSRPRLIERMNEGLHRRLILISAPAGSGKTTLLSEWIQAVVGARHAELSCVAPLAATPHASPPRAAWLSLDEGDNEPARFLSYMIAALRTIEPNIGREALGVLRSPQPPPIESILTSLINEIAPGRGGACPARASTGGLVLVLDDYHLIEAQPIHEAITFLLDHLPPRMHLVIATRSDPFLPLSRLRARGQMVEIRADDLRFSLQETTTFLNRVMGLTLSGDQVATLETRTEGWIAGLQLAALSMQSQEDIAGFLSAFTGDNRYIADYLVDEVLAQRPKDTTDFLLQTSILNRMTGPLCDAVTGYAGSQGVLERLEQANLFIVRLDNRRRWYRYHRLFADLLRQRLDESATSQDIESLHQHASRWYEENGFLIQAVEHGLAAGDHENVIRLIEEGVSDLFQRSQLDILTRWWTQLPRELVTSRPRLCMICAWAWLATGHPKEAEGCLQAIEQSLGTEMGELYPEREGARALSPTVRAALVEVAVVRTQLAIGQGNVPNTLKLSRLVLPYLEEDDQPYLHNAPRDSRTVVSFAVGIAHRLSGDLSAADRAFSDAVLLGQEQGNVHIVALGFGHLASVLAIQGRLRQAVQTCQRGLQLIQEMAGQRSPMSGLVQTELGKLLYEQNDLEAALHNLQEGIAVAKPWSFWDAFVPGYTGIARLRIAQGDWGGAFAAMDELAALAQNCPQPVMPVIESFRAKIWAAQGNVGDARRWAEASGLDAEGEIYYFQEEQFIILARVLIAEEKWGEALRLVDRLVEITETGRRWGRVIELLVLRAQVLDARGEQDGALEALARALTLAEPGGYVRVFIDQGEPVATLLDEAAARGITPDYVGKLLAALGAIPPHASTELGEVPPTPTLIEPLSLRELEVLRLLRTELSGPEIASELMIALSTVRTHTQNIYSKLNVSNRRAAVNQAEELDLI